jgi:hypothetical protein
MPRAQLGAALADNPNRSAGSARSRRSRGGCEPTCSRAPRRGMPPRQEEPRPLGARDPIGMILQGSLGRRGVARIKRSRRRRQRPATRTGPIHMAADASSRIEQCPHCGQRNRVGLGMMRCGRCRESFVVDPSESASTGGGPHTDWPPAAKEHMSGAGLLKSARADAGSIKPWTTIGVPRTSSQTGSCSASDRPTGSSSCSPERCSSTRRPSSQGGSTRHRHRAC